MCLHTNHQRPLVASRKIKVYKHVRYINNDSKVAITPFQATCFTLNKEFVAQPDTVDIIKESSGYALKGGVIHACLWPDFTKGSICLEAYIPEGVEYWIGIDKNTTCAKKIFVTDIEVTEKDFTGLDQEIAESVYAEAPCKNGIRIGDVIKENQQVKGVVIGFNGFKPLIADFRHIVSADVDYKCNSTLHMHLRIEKAMHDMNGQGHMEAWEKVCKDNPARFTAYHKVKALGDSYYIPALGEMELLWKNLIYIAAGLSLAGFSCPFNMSGCYWTSTEYSLQRNYSSTLDCNGAQRTIFYKYGIHQIIPFTVSVTGQKVVQAAKKKMSRLEWITRRNGFLRRLLR